jgi:hypothetical protein
MNFVNIGMMWKKLDKLKFHKSHIRGKDWRGFCKRNHERHVKRFRRILNGYSGKIKKMARQTL